MTYAEFLENILSELLKINSFAGRIKFADGNLQRIGSGSGRIVYDIDGQKVLKLAKNPKGVAQNGAEMDTGRYQDTQHIVTIVYESADDNAWIISEKAKKVTERRIKELTGIPSLSDLYYFLSNYESQAKGRRPIHRQDQELTDFFWENEFATQIGDLIANYSQHAGDMGRPSTYGEVLRDGQPSIVLTDYGLSDEVYSSHYERKPNKYQMYEMYNFADGNDDMLSDIGNVGQDQRRGMWALIPQGVGDGDEPMNEEFIDYVQNRNKYPEKRLPNLPFLADKFNECVNNIKETLNVVENKKLFYNNLLELQDYLVSQKFYEKEQLNHEEYVINEADVPDVQMFSLSDANYATNMANIVAQKLGLTTPKLLGKGENGFAFEINDNLVLKLTADVSEADAGIKLMRGNPKYLPEIFNIYKIVDTEANKAYFGLLEENINEKPLERFRKFDEDLALIFPNQGLNMFYKPMRRNFDYNTLAEKAKEILTANPEANVSEPDRKAAYDYVIGLLNIKQEMDNFSIKSNDYTVIANLGYKNGVLKYFDVGGRMGTPEPPIDDNNLLYIPEDATSKFSTIDSIGRDDFPVYDNNDTSPMTDNNIRTNEDLEYRHASDATQDKYTIDELVERVLSSMAGSSTVNVKKKCKLGGQGNTSAACNQGDISNLDIKPLTEASIPYNKTYWGWVSPSNEFIQVPQLQHAEYIRTKYPNLFMLDDVFEQAFKDGWVRVIYQYYQDRFSGSLSINGYDKKRVKHVLKTMFFDSIKYGDNQIYLAYENPDGGDMFRTNSADNKAKLASYISENVLNETGEGNAQPYDVTIKRSDDYKKEYSFRTEDNDYYEIIFNEQSLGDNKWYVAFGTKDADTDHYNFNVVVNKGKLYRVMATLLKVMKGFIANTKPVSIEIEPTKRNTMHVQDRGRFKLYLQYIKKNLPPDYEFLETHDAIFIEKKRGVSETQLILNNINEAKLLL